MKHATTHTENKKISLKVSKPDQMDFKERLVCARTAFKYTIRLCRSRPSG